MEKCSFYLQFSPYGSDYILRTKPVSLYLDKPAKHSLLWSQQEECSEQASVSEFFLLQLSLCSALGRLARVSMLCVGGRM